MIHHKLLFLSLLGLLVACSPLSEDRDLGRAPLGKVDSAGSCATTDGANFCGDISSGNCWCDDLCDSIGDCCPDKPEVCGASYDPCGDLACGDACSICDPSDPNCFETAVLKVCGSNGICSGSAANCSPTWDPCDGLSCGDACSLCDPSDPNCFETAVLKSCDAAGSCSASVPTCDGGDCCLLDDQPQCFEGATCCDDGSWSCNDGAGNSTCSEDGDVCSGLCCSADDEPQCFEGATCCDDGSWSCNDGAGNSTCLSGSGGVCL